VKPCSCPCLSVRRPRLRIALCAVISVGVLATTSRAQPKPAADQRFEFHSGFWVNLHHFLYWNALATPTKNRAGTVVLNRADADEVKQLTSDERQIWDAAVAYYQHSLVQRDLLFDESMIGIKNRLEDAEASPDLAGVAIPSNLRDVLLKAAPVYRTHFWPRHDSQNREWIARLQSLIEKYGAGMRTALLRIYEVPWPGEPVRVDAVAYGNWAGAYTTIDPTRPTISTSAQANQGPAALEIVFHETSHGMMDKVTDAIATAEKAANAGRSGRQIHFRRDLWHEVLFYTSGELVAERVPSYVAFADKNGLWTRAWPGPDRALIVQDWTPHMNGTVGLQQSLAKLVGDLAQATANQ